MTDDDCKRRWRMIENINNWKFLSASKHVDGETEEVADLVNALANVFGDSGWFDGDMGIIVGSAIENIEQESKGMNNVNA